MDTSKLKININLDDYNYQQDIQLRLFLTSLDPMELEVLKEIIDNSLLIPIEQMAEYLELPLLDLIGILKKLEPAALFSVDGDSLIVNKERRKRIEMEILKFEEGFKPDISYFLTLLNKLPIEILPTWYSLPKFSENISQSILKKIFITPKTYDTHLKEMRKDHQLLCDIMRTIDHSPSKKLESDMIKRQLNLQDHEFHQHIIHLEFYMACCLTYEKIDNQWIEYVSLCNEWQQYLNWQTNRSLTTIANTETIVRTRPDDFAFIKDMTILLTHLKNNLLPLESEEDSYHIPFSSATSLFEDLNSISASNQYTGELIAFCLRFSLCEITNSTLYILPQAEEWFSKTTHELGILLHRLIIKENIPNIEKNLLEIEKSLEPIAHLGWVYFDEYLNGLINPIGNARPVQLTKNGSKWSYSFPYYDSNDKELIRFLLCNRLFQSGIIAVGTKDSKLCFCVTSFGREALGSPSH